RSGCVTRAATSWPASRSASKEGIAKLPLPRKTMRKGALLLLPVVVLHAAAELALHQVALERREPVHEEEPVDVVDLVAEGPGEELRPRVDALPAVGVEALHDDARGPGGSAAVAGHGEAALLVALLALLLHDLGVHELD